MIILYLALVALGLAGYSIAVYVAWQAWPAWQVVKFVCVETGWQRTLPPGPEPARVVECGAGFHARATLEIPAMKRPLYRGAGYTPLSRCRVRLVTWEEDCRQRYVI